MLHTEPLLLNTSIINPIICNNSRFSRLLWALTFFAFHFIKICHCFYYNQNHQMMAAAAASCCSTPLSSLSRAHPRNGTPSPDQLLLTPIFGLSFRAVRGGLRAQNFSPLLRVSCLRDTKAAVVTGKSWNKLILESETPVLVEFYASWCGPCRMVHRVIDEISSEYAGRLKCFVLDADNDIKIAENYDIKAVPVVLLFKNGEKHEFVIGTMPKEFYVAAIERVLAS